MPVIGGARVASPLGGAVNPRISGQLNSYADDLWSPYVSESNVRVPGVYASHLPVSAMPRVITGAYSKTYKQDFYYRIHVLPKPVNFGNVVGVQKQDVELWNAFFEVKPLTRLDADGALGISFEFDPALVLPKAMPPLWSLQFKIVASPLGPPTILETLTVVVGGTTITVPLTGRRILLFPFPPNWTSAFDETFVFKSSVLAAVDQSEQTISAWGNQPRRNVEYNLLLTNLHAQKLDSMLFGWQGRFFGVIHWADKAPLTAPAASGSTVLSLDTTTRAFAVGGFLTLWASADDNASYQIASLTSSTVTLSAPITKTWPAGSRAYPTFSGVINASLSGTRLTDQVVQLPVSFECEPASFANTAVGGATPTYRGVELYLERTNWKAGVKFGYDSDREMIDRNVGKFYSHNPSGYSPRAQNHSWNITTRAQGVAIRSWLGRREGRTFPVFMPSGIEDFTLTGTVVIGSGYIDVKRSEYGALAAAHPARRDIIILMRSGVYYARRIIATTEPTTDVTRLQLDTTIPVTILVKDVKRISFLSLYRQTSDSATIRWLTDEVGTLDLELLAVRAP